MNPIKAIRQFIADVKQAINDPYLCLDEEGKRMWREVEQWEQEQTEKDE